jgi:4,5-DOPA dioxygenase extradiol
MNPLPTVFLSHGSPMHALEAGWVGAAWTELGRRLGKPRAVLVASAHWETDTPMLTSSPQPPTIHDFGGFPPALYGLRYPAPGAPDVAARAIELLAAGGIGARADPARGLDHGAWVPLRYLYPDADVPVVQLSVQPRLPARHSLAVGRRLEPLAREGVLVIGSGHMTHNLRDWMSTARSHGMRPTRMEPASYVRAFDAWVDDALHADDDRIAAWKDEAPHARRAHPSDEHFLPLPIAFAAAGRAPAVEHIDLGTDNGVLAMDAYLFTGRRRAVML